MGAPFMSRPIPLLAALLLCIPAVAHDKVESWLEVRSDHFIVATNSNEKQARKIADQFERMRFFFHALYPKLQVDPPAPIVVLALKDERDFRALEPVAYLNKGQVKLGGLFLRAPEKNYILMRLDVEGEHPYAVVYHEYTHLILAKAAEWMPLWLDEGLAQFYENTEIGEKETSFGEPNWDQVTFLRQNVLLPLPTLLKVDFTSPYYHEENKGSIFYAESWVLTHLLWMQDQHDKSHHLSDYMQLLAEKKIDAVTAATQAFGDLGQLQKKIESYIQQQSMHYMRLPVDRQGSAAADQAFPLKAAESDALRADFLAYNDRTADAHALLDEALKEDPNNTLAHETMGYLAFRGGDLDGAKKWYGEAVELDSQSYLAHYYFAAMSMRSPDSSDDARIESSLRTAIKLNSQFAPAFDSLAVFLAMHHRDLDEAHMMGLTAVGLEPENIGYRINVANVLMTMQQADAAIRVLQVAAKLAKTPQEIAQVNNFLMNAQAFATAQQRRAEMQSSAPQGQVEVKTEVEATPPSEHHAQFDPRGPHHFLIGVLKDVRCNNPAMDLTVISKIKNISLHADNYYQIQFTALNFTPQGDLNPCKDLEGRPAKVEYVESTDESVSPRVLSVELHK